jgi:tRNA pseudouridine55 synthase
MKNRLTHLEKALIISLIIELIIIAMLFNLGFKQKTKEIEYAVEFVDDDFDFNELQSDDKLELPDISKYVNKNRSSTNTASNMLQEDKSFEEFKQQQEQAIQEFYKNRENLQAINVGEDIPPKKKEEQENKNRYTGESNIKYFVKNRYDIYMENPLYVCPEYMSGIVAIDIIIDRNGKVVKASYNKNKSTTSYDCLIDNAINAAYESMFNTDLKAPKKQKGYITYRF